MSLQTQVVEALSNLLATGDEADRCYAARALGKLGDNAALDALVERLRDEDIDVCVDAAEALGQICDLRAVEPLLESLANDPSGEICTVIATALGQLGGSNANSALIKVAAERPEALEWQEDGDWDTWWDVQMEAVKALGEAKEEKAVDTLLEIMTSDDHQDIESEVLKSLAQIGGKGLDILIKRLQEGTPRERRRAAKALGLNGRQNGSPKAMLALGQALKDEDNHVRAATIDALAELGASRYLRAILLLLRDQDEEVRSAAIRACDRLAADADADDAEEIIKDLLPLLGDPSGLVRKTGFNTLTSVVQKHPLPTEALETVITSLSDPDQKVSSAACDLLGKNGDPAAIPELVETVADCGKTPMTRRQAALALGQIGKISSEIIDTLTKAVGGQDQTVRLASLTVLMELEATNPTTVSEAETGESAAETEVKTPLEIIISALRGQIEIAPADEEPSDEAEVEVEETGTEAETGETLKAETASGEPGEGMAKTNQIEVEFDPTAMGEAATTGDASEEHIAEQAQPLPLPDTPRPEGEGEQRAAISSLEAIAIDNVEAALAMEEEEPEQLDEEATHYMEMAEATKRESERMFVNRNIDVAADVRQLAARILGGSNREEAVNVLVETLKEEDEALTCDAIHSLGEIASRDRSIPSLMNASGPLVTQLAFGDRDKRLACARTLGKLGHKGAILPLFNTLEDEIKDVRIEAVRSLVELTLNGFDPDEHDHLVLEDINSATVAEKLVACLDDPAHGVRGAAAEGLARLVELEELRGATDEMVDKIIEKAFVGDGQQARRMGRAVRTMDASLGVQKLLFLLEESQSSFERRFIIEMLEELFDAPKGQQAA